MKDFLTVATIVKPQGIRGEVKVITMTDSPEDIQAFKRVYIGGVEYKLLKVRPQGDSCAFLTLGGIADRNAAELLRGKQVETARSDAPELPADTFYIADVIGCSVVDDTGAEVGEVIDITPARTDVYEVKKPDGKTLVFPAVDGVIIDINVAARRVVLSREKLAQVALDE